MNSKLFFQRYLRNSVELSNESLRRREVDRLKDPKHASKRNLKFDVFTVSIEEDACSPQYLFCRLPGNLTYEVLDGIRAGIKTRNSWAKRVARDSARLELVVKRVKPSFISELVC